MSIWSGQSIDLGQLESALRDRLEEMAESLLGRKRLLMAAAFGGVL
jgi:hypothetical protein